VVHRVLGARPRLDGALQVQIPMAAPKGACTSSARKVLIGAMSFADSQARTTMHSLRQSE